MSVPIGSVSGASMPRARDDVAVVVLDGEAVIHRHARVHALDRVATLVWQSCDGRATVDGIAVELATAFGQPPDRVQRDVRAAIEQLTSLDLLVDPDRAGAADEHGSVEVLEVLSDPPGSCASCADRTWAWLRSFRIGSRVITVGTDREDADAAIAGALAAHLVELPEPRPAELPFLAVELHDRPAGGGLQRLDLLLRGDSVLARSRRPDQVLRALVAHLASYGDVHETGLATVNGLVAARGNHAVIVEAPHDLVRFRHALASRGVLTADLPVALVDPVRGEVVVGAPGLDVDLAPIDALAVESGSESEALPWGRYRVTAVCVTGAPTASGALLAFGPEAGDHRDHDATIAAVLALLDSVPVAGAGDPDAIDALLAAG